MSSTVYPFQFLRDKDPFLRNGPYSVCIHTCVHVCMRHKCREERAESVQIQKGAIQCRQCELCFKSKGGIAVRIRGIAVHKYRPITHPSSGLPPDIRRVM